MKRVQSFEDARRRRSRILRFLKYVAVLYVVFETFSAFALKTWVVSSSAMQPTLAPRDRVVVASSSYGLFNPFNGKRASFKSPRRGDLVLLSLPSSRNRPWHERLVDSAVRFLTFQRLGSSGLRSTFDAPVIKRVVAGPGDSVMLDGFIVYVKSSGTTHYLTEYEVSGADYDIIRGKPVAGWGADMPLAGTMTSLELGPGEFFVVGEDRFSSADSRFFGPVAEERFLGKVVLRYWPLDRISGF